MSRTYTGIIDIGAGHDTNLHMCSAIWVGTGGNVNVVAANGSTAVITAVPNGTLIELAVKQVKATSTTASNIVGLI